MSNWTERDVWDYVRQEALEVASLYFAADRLVVDRDGSLIIVDDDRFRLAEGEAPVMRRVRVRTLGCYPLTGAMISDAETVEQVVAEMDGERSSERAGRLIDRDSTASMERKKKQGYF